MVPFVMFAMAPYPRYPRYVPAPERPLFARMRFLAIKVRLQASLLFDQGLPQLPAHGKAPL